MVCRACGPEFLKQERYRPAAQTQTQMQETRLRIFSDNPRHTDPGSSPKCTETCTWPTREDPAIQTHCRKAKARQTHRHTSLINRRHSGRDRPAAQTRLHAQTVSCENCIHSAPVPGPLLPSCPSAQLLHSSSSTFGISPGRIRAGCWECSNDQDSPGFAPRDSESSEGVRSISRQ